MTEIITANVTAENGSQWKADRPGWTGPDCLIGRALREATGESWSVGLVFATRQRDRKTFDLPTYVQKQTMAWLRDQAVAPFTFTITDEE